MLGLTTVVVDLARAGSIVVGFSPTPLLDAPLVPAVVDTASWRIGSAALTGILLEVCAHPKPGLVTPHSMGSHVDMDVRTFMLSSAAIAPCFYQCAALGRGHHGDIALLLPAIRAIGREFDTALVGATHGVNTQRGALFCAGLLSAAAGHVAQCSETPSAELVCATVAEISRGLCDRELRAKRGNSHTAGEVLFRRYGSLGIRGEVEAGFPSVIGHGLPALRSALAAGHGLNRSLVHALVALIAVAEDTTVLWRGGPDALAFVRTEARRAVSFGGALTAAGLDVIRDFDAACVARGISPGGAADLLSICAAAYLIEHRAFPQTATSGFCLDAGGSAPTATEIDDERHRVRPVRLRHNGGDRLCRDRTDRAAQQDDGQTRGSVTRANKLPV